LNNLRILVVDDDAGLRSVLRLSLLTAGHAVTTAKDGREALGLCESTTFDAILLDLEMPVMNGREFFRQFRLSGGKIPIIIVSAFGAQAAQAELGAAASISKPFDPLALPALVSDLIAS
jgi:CheY-like chemotaxis protein